jgi:hypothetical protein
MLNVLVVKCFKIDFPSNIIVGSDWFYGAALHFSKADLFKIFLE